jgi:hypothetical protein
MRISTIFRKVVIAVISIFALTIFSACGSGGGDDSASFKNSETLIPIDVDCITNPTVLQIETYIKLESNDVIVKDNDEAEISIYHDINGNKSVCLITPTAHIIRQ